MATTISIVTNSRTPDSVILRLTNDGVADLAPLVLLKATLLAGLMDGPLKELINRTPDLTALNFATNAARADYVRITEVVGGLNAVLLPAFTTTECIFVAGGLSYSICTGPAASDLLVELRAVFSNER